MFSSQKGKGLSGVVSGMQSKKLAIFILEKIRFEQLPYVRRNRITLLLFMGKLILRNESFWFHINALSEDF